MPPQEKFPETSSEDSTCAEVKMEMASAYSNKAYVSDSSQDKVQKPVKDVKEVNDSFDFDDLLPHIGEFGLYQKILFLLMIPFAFFVAWVYFTQIFITITPEQYWCRVPELEHLTPEERWVYFP